MKRFLLAAPLLVALVAAVGCDNASVQHAGMWSGVTKAVAVLHGTAGHEGVHGVVTFTQMDDKVHVVADVTGLPPNSKHGFHVHEYGDCSKLDASSAGGHYNPEGKPHGLPPSADRHAGDLGNITADASGHGMLDLTVDNITIAGMHNPIVGRGLILHVDPDDGGQPTGNAGARMASGVIGIAKSQ
ncbi:MAG: hypothetical protein BIFFINMI_00571 [Phycisphaerae bacterium]|nr:hypothetical protein [Phycisphaerae bacterium]